ncbi:MAG: ABC transporter permease [Spirochaetales bacterium]
MYRYVIKRLLMLVPIIIGVSFLIYFIMDLAPGDIISQMAGEGTDAQIQVLRHQYGYDRSVFYRYVMYMKNLVQGNLGTSFLTNKPVWDMYRERLPETLKLALGALVVSILLSIPLGILSAVRSGTLWDNAGMVLALLGLSMPNFWLGLLLIILFSLKLGWFPSGGDTGFLSIILPAITIGTGHVAIITRTTRSSMIDVIHQDYLRTARAKGVPEKYVIRKHAFKNALIPIITIIGTQMSVSLGGAVLTETVFAWPGVGRLIIDSVHQRDVPTVTGAIIMTTILISIMLLIVDLLYAYVDPRIKAQYLRKGKG